MRGDRRGNRDDGERPALRIDSGADRVDELTRHLEVGVRRVALVVHQNGAHRRERGQDVHVPAGPELLVVTRQPALQPHHVRDAEARAQFVLHLGACPVGIAVGIHLHGLGHQNGAGAVHVDAAALVRQW